MVGMEIDATVVGAVIGGKYRVERVLGKGGMGVVVAATHVDLEQRVAIKILTDNPGDSRARRRFLREARAAARLTSEHVVQVFDIGELEAGAPYIVMERLRGADLHRLVRKRGPLAIDVAVGYLLEACEAIAEAHAAGIIHRDLKPSNLFLAKRTTGARIKVLDFGISKALPQSQALDDEDITSNEALLGTPHFMAPEQMTSAATVDARADIWSLGAVLHYLLTGKKPFVAPNLSLLLVAVLHGEPVPVRRIRPDVPKELEAIVSRCLHREITGRFASVTELTRALIPFGPEDAQQSLDRISLLVEARPESIPPPDSGHRDETAGSEATSSTATEGYRDGGTTQGAADVEPELDADRTEGSHDVDVPAESPPRRGRWLGAALTLAALAIAAAAYQSTRDTPAPATQPPAPPLSPPLGVASGFEHATATARSPEPASTSAASGAAVKARSSAAVPPPQPPPPPATTSARRPRARPRRPRLKRRSIRSKWSSRSLGPWHPGVVTSHRDRSFGEQQRNAHPEGSRRERRAPVRADARASVLAQPAWLPPFPAGDRNDGDRPIRGLPSDRARRWPRLAQARRDDARRRRRRGGVA
jgi:serine/threonine-protein kinase